MSFRVSKAVLWKIETPNTPGAMAASLGPLADNGVNLDLVMGYVNSDKTIASIEVYPVTTARAQKAARSAGYSKADLPCVVVSGKNRAGIGREISASLADAGINFNFFVAQVQGNRYVGLFSFEAQSEADIAMKVLKNSLKTGGPKAKKKKKKKKKAR